ncbi:JAB domain-containing protein [Enterovibrio norvegicus]|uniref:JAB domain-containing protein n=1 Tax=Enterovibrio norvegicus TaxID=188144 RepID=A0ABV4L6Q2_9GAMM
MYSKEEKKMVKTAISIVEKVFNRKSFDALSSPDVVKDYLKLKLSNKSIECFGVFYLDNQNRVIDNEIISKGTIDKAQVYPREVVKSVLAMNCNAVIFYHNHPSGIAEPSAADKYITNRCADALSLVDVRTLDHMIIGENDVYSFAEHGLI